ncbi:PREDICTED: leucine-rich repeat-containing protein 16C-like, partial [Cyprinodon variegatus]|uniref:leucine-rich repeat-containing protein 16C-like n=1 Tax=Cyprinodon variegatus TaxID=28743 RepID=UPI0007425898
KLVKTAPQDLQERLLKLTGVIEEQLNSQPGPCGGFSDTYAALCDLNEIPFREEIQWDIDNIYYTHNWKKFNLQDFSHLESKDLALAVAALSFNQWFTKIYCKGLKLSVDVQQQLTFLLSKSSTLEELSLEECGLKVDFAVKMATALHEGPPSALQAINLSGNSVEDKGVIALSQEIQHLNEGLQVLSLSRVSMSSKGTNAAWKVREVTTSVQEFFSQSCELRYVGLSATKLPPQALRLLLQGLATNTHLCGLALDLSSCELCSAGAQVIQEHISEATAIRTLDISDNSFENDMVTLVLSVGRCKSLRHLALGRNFAMKSRALTDLLHRIAQLIQDDECGHATLAELDISGNNIGDTGAKMLAKALMTNTKLRSLTWDRNNVTARGFQDVADALERNFTLQEMSLPLADISQSYRSSPDRIKDALHKIQLCLDRNKMKHPGSVELKQLFRSQPSEKLIQGMCRQLEDSLQRISLCNAQLVQNDIMTAHEVLQNARESLKLLPSLCEESRKSVSDGDWVMDILSDTTSALTQEITKNLQEFGQGLMGYAETVCPRVVQRSSVCKSLSECISKRSKQAETFLKSTLVETAGQKISSRLSELRQTLAVTLAESMVEQVLQDLTAAQDKMDCLISENSSSAQRINIPELRLTDSDFPTDDYSPAFWRNGLLSQSLRPAASIKIMHDHKPDPVSEDKKDGNEAMDRVDEGVEEFFTKKILPDYALKGRWEESNSTQVPESSTTPLPSPSDITLSTTTITSPSATSTDTSFPSLDVHSLPSSTTFPSTTSSTTSAIPTKNIKKKFGDFFVFKRARAGRSAKTGGGDGGQGSEVVKVKRSSIADLIRPLRETKDRDRDREREKERWKVSEEDANICNDATTTEGTVAPGCHLADVVRETVPPAESLSTTQSSGTTPPYPTVATSPGLTTAVLAELEEAAAPVPPPRLSPTPAIFTTPAAPERQPGDPSCGERRLRVTKRLRENKSQSLILLTGIEAEDKDNTPNKKHASESTPGFEQRLQVMLHRMGVTKTPPADTKMCQNKDEELRKATSEGAILNKPELPPKDIKSRTMSTSSAEPRHPLRLQDPNRPVLLYPKPALPERLVPPPPARPSLAVKPPPPIPAARPSSAPALSSSSEQIQQQDGRPMETTQQNGSQDGAQGETIRLSPRKELRPSAPRPWRGDAAPDRSEKAQSVTDAKQSEEEQVKNQMDEQKAERGPTVGGTTNKELLFTAESSSATRMRNSPDKTLPVMERPPDPPRKETVLRTQRLSCTHRDLLARKETVLLTQRPSCTSRDHPARTKTVLHAQRPSCASRDHPARTKTVLHAQRPSCAHRDLPTCTKTRPSCASRDHPARTKTVLHAQRPSCAHRDLPTCKETVLHAQTLSCAPRDRPAHPETIMRAQRLFCTHRDRPARPETVLHAQRPSCPHRDHPTCPKTVLCTQRLSCAPRDHPARTKTVLHAQRPSCVPRDRPARTENVLRAQRPSYVPKNRPAHTEIVLRARRPSCAPRDRPARTETVLRAQRPSCAHRDRPARPETVLRAQRPSCAHRDRPACTETVLRAQRPPARTETVLRAQRPSCAPRDRPARTETVLHAQRSSCTYKDRPTRPETVLHAQRPDRPARTETVLHAQRPSCAPRDRPARTETVLHAQRPSCTHRDRPARPETVLRAQRPSCTHRDRTARTEIFLHVQRPSYAPRDRRGSTETILRTRILSWKSLATSGRSDVCLSFFNFWG